VAEKRKYIIDAGLAQDRQKLRLENIGLRAIRKTLRQMNAAVLAGFSSGVNPLEIIGLELPKVQQVLTDAMIATHLDGHRRGLLTAAPHMRVNQKLAGTAYDEAIDFLKTRLLISDEEIKILAQQYGPVAVQQITQMSDLANKQINEALLEISTANLALPQAQAKLAVAMQKSGLSIKPWAVETVFRTNVSIAYNAGRVNANSDPAVQEILWGYEYLTVGDDRVRPTHAAMDGVRAPKDDPFWKENMPPNGYNSFAPWTKVEGSVVAASKALYSGPMVTLKTSRGNTLSVTVNHPVLTRHGFKAAGDITKSDDLVHYVGQAERLPFSAGNNAIADPLMTRWAVDNQNAPPTIENVFDAFLAQGMVTTAPGCSALDFHGDGKFMYGDIQIVIPKCLLMNADNPHALKRVDDIDFMVGLISKANFHPRFSLSGGGKFCSIGSASNVNSPLDQSLSDGAARGTDLLSKLQQGYPGLVSLDKVIDVKIEFFSGHVFDLQSPNGWIVADGIVASNCRCVVVELFDNNNTPKYPPAQVELPNGKLTTVGADAGFGFNPGDVFHDYLKI
jgi:SPP1 gp7 family putative phage head morphogenesis protein